jgi:23S rRNA pseudouridine1911/1915/1917 synthase
MPTMSLPPQRQRRVRAGVRPTGTALQAERVPINATSGQVLIDPASQADDAPWSDEPEWRSISIPAELHGQRLDKVLVAMAPEFSRSHLQHLVKGGHVRLDGHAAVSASCKVAAGQRVELVLVPGAQSLAFRPEPIALDVVHEDEHLLVLNKTAGMVVHPAAGNWSGTLLNALLAHHRGAAEVARAGIVHRLDKDTSGLMVVAKTVATHATLVRAIAAREVHREYQAIVHGAVATTAFVIEAALGRDPRSRVRMSVLERGKPARTDVQAIAVQGGFSALRCTLHTGRTHQIRVHLASRGHPLVGDAIYGGSPALGLQRQALHAVRLAFVHPHSGQQLVFEAPAPEDFKSAWCTLAD